MKKGKFNKEFIPAIHQLIKEYESHACNSDECPLCVVALELAKRNNVEDWCRYCPWVRMEKQTCTYAFYDVAPYDKRIERLKSWLKNRVEA